ncbi:MAG TPA: hypothetical protein VHY19_07115 [Steroidobacteraceae bacterium]|jgi:hypothetical protein|nr:hypothetical protein [Steroidobacteraceae bacterium]
MAILWRTRGTFGPDDSIDYGTSMELPVIEQRLINHKVAFLGPKPREADPTGQWLMHPVVQVLLEDELTAKFPMPGYYYVPELNSRDAGFLFEPSNPRPR